MTFFDVSKKMLKANLKRYRLYFLCNVLAITLFFCFAAIFTNQSFMNGRIVNSMISSNIIAPSLFTGVFVVLFTPWSYSAFMKNRKQEYGIFITLGMSEQEALANILLENGAIAGLSLLCGLPLGTGIAFVFYVIIQQVIGIRGLTWAISPAAYGYTALLFAGAILLTLITGVAGFLKTQLIDLIHDRFRAEKKGKSPPWLFPVGTVTVIASVLVMLVYGNGDSALWLIDMAVLFAGLWLMIAGGEKCEQVFLSKIPGYRRRHILGLSFMRQHDSSRRRIGTIAAWMVAFSLFFAALCAALVPIQLHNAASYSPYDLVFSRVFGMNQVEPNEIKNVLAPYGITVKESKQVEYLRNRVFNLLPVSEVNKTFGCQYQIRKGEFLYLYQYDPNDGYEHETDDSPVVSFPCGKDKVTLKSVGADVKILFNDNPTFGDWTLIVSDSDYQTIESKGNGFWAGIIQLYSFDNWKASGKAVDAVQNYLLKKNQTTPDEQHTYYRASSRIETYTTNTQSMEFLLFLMSFIVILFYGASDLMVHFQIRAEAEEESRVLSGLHRLGVTENEMLAMIRYKNGWYFLPQAVLGLFISTFYSYTVNKPYGYGWQAAGFCLLIGFVFAALQLILVRCYSGRELRRFDALLQ